MAAPPRETGMAAPPRGTGMAAPPRETAMAAPPRETGMAAPPRETGMAAPPRGTAMAAPPRETGMAAPPRGTGMAAPPRGTGMAAPPRGTAMAAPSLAWTTYLKLDLLAILQSCHLLPPVKEVCVIDDVASILREVDNTVVVQMEFVMSGVNKPVAETRLPCPLSCAAVEAGRGETTHSHSSGGDLTPLASHGNDMEEASSQLDSDSSCAATHYIGMVAIWLQGQDSWIQGCL